jgi:hypothetical protein
MGNNTTQAKVTRQQAVDQLLDQLPTRNRAELRNLWRDLFGREASPRLRRETLIPILAYRLQEKTYGCLKEPAARKLCELTGNCSDGRKSTAPTILRPKVGTRYIREHQGRLHEVTVLELSYEYEGNTYGSLTEIARVITGAKWSGPAFFGLRRKTRREVS